MIALYSDTLRPMFNLTKISLQRGGNWLFDNASLRANTGDRIGLLGQNGSGKTSLLKLLLGELESDSGEVHLPGNTIIASTEQETLATNRSALDYVIDGHKELRALQKKLNSAQEIENNSQIALLLESLDSIHAYQAPITAAKLLSGLGFSVSEHQKSVTDFSGGWRMRLNLAKALMCPSDLLLLDEPTNHLDLDAVFWLEDWLKNYKGTLLLISHDAVFLDSVVTHIAHVSEKSLELYTGNYSSFSKQRAEKLALQQSMADKQKNQRQHLESFIDRFRAQATKAKQVQSRVKMLEKLENITLARVASPVQFTFINTGALPNPLLYLENANMGYTNPILNNISFSLSPGSRIGLIGKNGAGKSTLIKTLGNQIPTLSGEFYSADKLNIGYFSQHQLETLRSEESPLWHLQQQAKDVREQTLRDFLGSFNFIGDRATNPVAPLSGGEKARLCLALIIWNKPNLLLLDEPTNHLDLDTRAALTSAVQDFTGALIIVSHDRALLETSCDEYWLVDSEKVVPFNGDLADYKSWLFDSKKRLNKPLKQKSQSSFDQKEKKQIQAKLRQKLSPIKKKLSSTETKISQLNSKLKEIELNLSDNNLYSQKNKNELSIILEQQITTTQTLQIEENEWMELQEILEELTSNNSQ